MSAEQTPETQEPAPSSVSVESGGDVSVGGDVAGRDVVKTTTTHIGFGVKEVQRLVLTVGALVFVTAACFFSGGIAVGFATFNALQRPVNSDNPPAAARFASYIHDVRSLPPGQPFILGFTEEEISSSFRLNVAPQAGVANGKVRLLDEPGKLVVGGEAARLGGLPFVATFEVQGTPGAPLKLTAVAVQILKINNSPFGWVFVPPALLQSVEDDLNSLFANAQLTRVELASPAPDPAWVVNGVAQ